MASFWRTQPTSRWDAREQLLARFDRSIQSGHDTPFLNPWSTASAGLVLIYLLIPQGQSDFVRQLRFVVWTINTVFSLYGIIYARMRLTLGYCGGLLSAWAVLWISVLLLNNDVQRDFKRIESIYSSENKPVASSNGYVDMKESASTPNTARTKYRWQPFPATSFRKRILWVADLFTGLRGIGWNWQLPTVAPAPFYVRKQLGEVTKDDPTIGRDGTRRYDTASTLLRARATKFVACYLSLDLLIILATHDSYFWGLVDSPAPTFLPKMMQDSAFLLRTYRNIFTMLAVYAALQFFFALGPLIFVGLLGRKRIGVWGEPWMNPDVWGSFGKVLDHGLIGFWGSWWHQAFRYAFESNSTALMRLFKLDEKTAGGKFAKIMFAFVLSGFLHASGSYASFGDSRPLSGSFIFFVLQPFGIAAQMLLKQGLRKTGVANKMPRLVQQAFTLSLTYLWLHFTAPLLCDDFARTGIWMIEPLPISPLRALGFGDPRDSWWCWRGSWMRWHGGNHWWQTGIAL